MEAIIRRDASIVKQLILAGANVNAVNEGTKQTPLLYLTSAGGRINKDDIEICNELIHAGAKVNYICNDDDCIYKETPLIDACTHGNYEIAEALLKEGADANIEGYENLTAICFLDYKSDKSINMFETLISYGANVNAGDGSPLKQATKYKKHKVINLLLSAGANVKDCTPLVYKEVKEKNNIVKSIESLVFEGLAGKEAESFGLIEDAIRLDLIESVKLLVNSGLDVNTKHGIILQIAISKLNIEILEFLIKAGANPNIKSKDDMFEGRTALMSFFTDDLGSLFEFDFDFEEKKMKDFWDNKWKLYFLLFEKLTDVNIQDNKGKSLIFYIIICQNYSELDDILFKPYMNINLQDNEGNTVLMYFLIYIQKNKDGKILKEDIEKIRWLLIAGSDININNLGGDSPFSFAKIIGNAEILKLFNNANKLINTEDNNGCTPLLIASAQSYEEHVNWLINNGANVNTKNNCQTINHREKLDNNYINSWKEKLKLSYTALMVAKNIETIRALVKAGANINEKNNDGNTSLMLYAKRNWFDGVKELIAAGADTSLVNKRYETALGIAKKNKTQRKAYHPDMLSLLEQETKEGLVTSILSKFL